MLSRNDAFNRHTHWPDACYQVIDTLGMRLLERLAAVKYKPGVILDVGSGTGAMTQRLSAQYPKARIYALDWAHQRNRVMMSKSKRWSRRIHALTAHMQHIPLADNSVDLLFSHLALYWSQHPGAVMSECQRVLKPGGLLMFTSLGPDSYRELRQAWVEVDTRPHVNVFLDLHEWGDAMLAAGLQDPVMDVERLTVTYQDVATILQDLHLLGQTNRHPQRRRGLMGRQRWRAMLAAYQHLQLPNGLYPVSLEVSYGHAWGGDVSVPLQRVNNEGEVLVDVSILKN